MIKQGGNGDSRTYRHLRKRSIACRRWIEAGGSWSTRGQVPLMLGGTRHKGYKVTYLQL